MALNQKTTIQTVFKPTEKQYQTVAVFNHYLTQRLEATGFSPDEIRLFFLRTMHFGDATANFSMIDDANKLLEAIDQIPSFHTMHTLEKMHALLFDGLIAKTHNGTAGEVFATLGHSLYDPLVGDGGRRGIPVDEQTFLAIVKKMHEWDLNGAYWQEGIIDQDMVDNVRQACFINFLVNYIGKTCYPVEKTKQGTERRLDQAKVRRIMESIEAMHIPVDYERIMHQIKYEGLESRETLLANIGQVAERKSVAIDWKEKIDTLLENYNSEKNFRGFRTNISDRLHEIRKDLDKEDISDAQRFELVKHFSEKVKSVGLQSEVDLNRVLFLGLSEDENSPELQRRIVESNLILNAALILLKKDDDQFYRFMTEVMESSDIDITKISRTGLAKLCGSLLGIDQDKILLFDNNSLYIGLRKNSFEHIEVTDYEKYFDLPWLRGLRDMQDTLSFTSLHDLLAYADSELKDSGRGLGFGETDIFSDSVNSLVVGRGIRRNFLELLKTDLQESEFNDLQDFIKEYYPPGADKKEFLRQIDLRYLQSTSHELTLGHKTDYLLKNYDAIGPEGMVIIAKQIHTLADYLEFRSKMTKRLQEYLGGSKIIDQIAKMEYGSSFFTKDFPLLLESSKTDAKAKKETSTNLAKLWSEFFFRRGERVGIKYDKETRKFGLDVSARGIFQSFHDLIEEMRTMSPLKRFALVQDGLTNSGGGLTSEESRKELGKLLTDSLAINSSFISQAMQEGCALAPAEYFSFPISQMLSPLLFRSFDVTAVDTSQVREMAEIPRETVQTLLKANTRDITVFGSHYQQSTQSYPFVLAQESDVQYHTAKDALSKELLAEKRRKEAEPRREVDANEIAPAIEAVIGGAEASGPLFKRCLQLARQLMHFSPPVDRRLADSQDSTPSLNMLLFWENVVRTIENTNSDSNLVDFLKNKMLTVDGIIGGGALNTVASGTALTEDGEVAEVVYRWLNPNPEVFIRATHDLSDKVLTRIEERGKRKDKKYARMGHVFVDMSQEWCLRDINDPNYEADDDRFRNIIAEYDAKRREGIPFYAPQRVFTHRKLKVERTAKGVTVNRFLNDENVAKEEKQRITGALIDFHEHQLESQRATGEGSTTSDDILFQSDPHVGNYMIDYNGSIAVLDRNMALHLTAQETEVFTDVLRTGNYREFVDPFIACILERNKDRLPQGQEAGRIKAKLKRALKGEYLKQQAGRLVRLRRDTDNFGLIKTLLSECQESGLDIPLEHRLMVRNVESDRLLRKKY